MGSEPMAPTFAGCGRRHDQDLPKASVRRMSRQLGARVALRLRAELRAGNGQCPLLPKLLPNAVARSGTETNEEPSNTAKVPKNRDVRGCTGIVGDGGERISSAVFSTTQPPLRRPASRQGDG
jgi:hypothetical protein